MAWGQLFIDTGEEQEMEERGEYVNFRAEVQPSGNGILTGTFSSSGAAPTVDAHPLHCGKLWTWIQSLTSRALEGTAARLYQQVAMGHLSVLLRPQFSIQGCTGPLCKAILPNYGDICLCRGVACR